VDRAHRMERKTSFIDPRQRAEMQRPPRPTKGHFSKASPLQKSGGSDGQTCSKEPGGERKDSLRGLCEENGRKKYRTKGRPQPSRKSSTVKRTSFHPRAYGFLGRKIASSTMSGDRRGQKKGGVERYWKLVGTYFGHGSGVFLWWIMNRRQSKAMSGKTRLRMPTMKGGKGKEHLLRSKGK